MQRKCPKTKYLSTDAHRTYMLYMEARGLLVMGQHAIISGEGIGEKSEITYRDIAVKYILFTS